MLAALLITRVIQGLQHDRSPLSAIIARLTRWQSTGEVNFRIEAKDEAIQALVRELPGTERPVRVLDFDGYRLDFRDWWFNVRKSNTEPYLRFIAEALDPDKLAERLEQARNILGRYS